MEEEGINLSAPCDLVVGVDSSKRTCYMRERKEGTAYEGDNHHIVIRWGAGITIVTCFLVRFRSDSLS